MKDVFKMRRLWILLTVPVSFALIFVSSSLPGFAEIYAERVYPYLSRGLNAVTSLLPFSLAEILVYLLIVFLAAALLRFIVRLIRLKGKRGETVARFFINLLCGAGILLFLFTINCGINYYRSTFSDTCGLTVKESSSEELITLCKSLAEDSNTLRAKVKTDSNSVMLLQKRSFHANADTARISFDRLSTKFPLLQSGYGAPKPVFASLAMSRCNITGIFFPFTFEANINTDVPEYTIPFTMCHELSHLRGYMREDEANFIAYLACRGSNDIDFRYSGAAMAFTYASNALFSTDSEEAAKIFSSLSEGVRRDLVFNNEYWKQFTGPVADAADSINDSYLKANRQQDGVQSYGRMVDLLLALQRSENANKN
jgi:hypothetical protein